MKRDSFALANNMVVKKLFSCYQNRKRPQCDESDDKIFICSFYNDYKYIKSAKFIRDIPLQKGKLYIVRK